MVCHLEPLVGRTAPVKERRAVNESKGLSGVGFDQIPVSIIFEVIGRTS